MREAFDASCRSMTGTELRLSRKRRTHGTLWALVLPAVNATNRRNATRHNHSHRVRWAPHADGAKGVHDLTFLQVWMLTAAHKTAAQPHPAIYARARMPIARSETYIEA